MKSIKLTICKYYLKNSEEPFDCEFNQYLTGTSILNKDLIIPLIEQEQCDEVVEYDVISKKDLFNQIINWCYVGDDPRVNDRISTGRTYYLEMTEFNNRLINDVISTVKRTIRILNSSINKLETNKVVSSTFKIFNENTVYHIDELKYVLGKYNYKDLNQGDKVKILVDRCTKARQYGSFTGKHHGYVLVNGVVKIEHNGCRRIIIDKNDINKWSEPIGTEIIKQGVDITNPYNRLDYIVEILK